jgi:hypothetical protein
LAPPAVEGTRTLIPQRGGVGCRIQKRTAPRWPGSWPS